MHCWLEGLESYDIVVTFQLFFICKWMHVQIFSILVSKEMIFSFIIIIVLCVWMCVVAVKLYKKYLNSILISNSNSNSYLPRTQYTSVTGLTYSDSCYSLEHWTRYINGIRKNKLYRLFFPFFYIQFHSNSYNGWDKQSFSKQFFW